MTTHYLNLYVKCISVKHNIFYCWDSKKLLWIKSNLVLILHLNNRYNNIKLSFK